jgi:Glycosyl transferase family 11
MIGYNRLGSNGRLGNQMFQYAALRGIAAKRGYDWVIPPENYNHTDNYGLFETFEMKNAKQSNLGFVDGQSVEENDYCFIPEFFDECPDNVSLEGYFQTEKYFNHIENEIREDFTFKKEYLIPCKEYIDSLDASPIFLHVRQLDNIGREDYHPILPISFFEEALSNFPDDTPCFVFTDDIGWCKSQEFFKQERFLFNENNQKYSYQTIDGRGKSQNTLMPQVDLCLMSLCSGAIIANSSFSWWGAWLQNNRGKIIAPNPQKWFGSKMKNLDTKDIIPDRWNTQDWSK